MAFSTSHLLLCLGIWEFGLGKFNSVGSGMFQWIVRLGKSLEKYS